LGVVVGVTLIAFVTYFFWDTYTPRPQAYEVSADGRQITVAFCGRTAETVSAQSLREDEQNVVVDIRLRMHRDVFQHGGAHKVTFALRGPLRDRIVRDGSGNAVPPGSQFLCPG